MFRRELLKPKVEEGENMYYESYLSHYGVKGQHWGVRRYQNEDGTLTSIGKKRQERLTSSDKKR